MSRRHPKLKNYDNVDFNPSVNIKKEDYDVRRKVDGSAAWKSAGFGIARDLVELGGKQMVDNRVRTKDCYVGRAKSKARTRAGAEAEADAHFCNAEASAFRHGLGTGAKASACVAKASAKASLIPE